MNKSKMQIKRRLHEGLVVLLSLMVVVDLVGINHVLASASGQIGASLTICDGECPLSPPIPPPALEPTPVTGGGLPIFIFGNINKTSPEELKKPTEEIKPVINEDKNTSREEKLGATTTEKTIKIPEIIKPIEELVSLIPLNEILKDISFIDPTKIKIGEQELVISIDHNNRSLDILISEEYPIFSGQTTAFAYVYLTLFSDPIIGVTQADEKGNWSWASPRSIQGIHNMFVMISEKQRPLSEILFAIRPANLDILNSLNINTDLVTLENIHKITEELGLYLNFSIDAKTQKIAPGEIVNYRLDFENRLNENIFGEVNFKLKNKAGEVLQEKNSSFDTQKSLVVTGNFRIPKDYKEGIYYIEAYYENANQTFSQAVNFQLNKTFQKITIVNYVKAMPPSNQISLLVLLVGLIIFLLGLLYEIRVLTKLKEIAEVDEDDLMGQIV